MTVPPGRGPHGLVLGFAGVAVAYLVGVVALTEPSHPTVLIGAAAILAAVAAEVRATT